MTKDVAESPLQIDDTPATSETGRDAPGEPRSAQNGSASASRRFTLALLLILLAGAGCRAAQYLSNRSFWQDEAFIVLNFRNRTAAQLLDRLNYNQAAPPLFLLAERAVAVTLGASEYALRLLPLLAGIASLGLMAALARRVLSPPAALVAVALFAFSDRMIWHAVEVKPYSMDVMAALLLTLSALAGAGRVSATARLARTAALATALVWLSYPSVFAFGGLSLALAPAVIGSGFRGKPSLRGAVRYVALNLPVVVSFLLVLVLVVRRQEQSAALNAYWAEHDFPDVSRPQLFPLWLGRKLITLFNYGNDMLGPVLFVLGVIGVISLAAPLRRRSGDPGAQAAVRRRMEGPALLHYFTPPLPPRARGKRRRLELLGALTLSAVLVVLAACVRRYPFDGERVNSFLVPGAMLLAGLGLEAGMRWVVARYAKGDPERVRRWWRIAGAALLALPVGMCAYYLLFPRTRAHVRPAAEYVARHYRPGDQIYCDPHVHQFLCYWPPAGAAAGPWVESLRGESTRPKAIRELSKDKSPAGRFWVVLAYDPGHAREVEKRLAPARAVGTERGAFHGYGGTAVLFEGNTDAPSPPITSPDLRP